MNILFLTIAYPESADDSNLYTDLMQEFSIRNNNVFVVTSCERKCKKKTSLNIENGINVLRVKTGNLQKTSRVEKGISTLLLEYLFKKAIYKYYKEIRFDLIIYSTPPVTFTKLIKFIKERDHAKAYLLLKDIFPQNAVDIGLMKKDSFIYRFFRNKEIELYKNSDYIGCMSQSNLRYVLQHNPYLFEEKIEVCPNSIYPNNIALDIKEKTFVRKKYGISNDTVVFIYGGNLGKPQGIPFLYDIIYTQRKNKNVFFIIAGSGTEYKYIENKIRSDKIENVILLKQLLKKEYEELVQASDIGLIFLDKRFTIPNFPSRILSYMQYALPVIAATDKSTDIGKIIEGGNFGYWCESEDLNGFNDIIDRILLNRNLIPSLGANSRRYLDENYTVRHSCDIILKHL